ncbi:hypothetical protein [Clostridium sp.]|uniref:hypothetical protein n=1 Tax=Clostridium sp. TaxID=1506 RepID=UPI0028415FEC|nr:hypothetical protein [Clostridium sp.]MDR3594564.1 hypothetical protein [Clostridium sp.]
MIKIKDKYYKLTLLDTCIISELLKNKGELSKNILSKVINKGYVCFSDETIKELIRSPIIFNEFIEIFSYFPSLILKPFGMLMDEEIQNYDIQKEIDPVLMILNQSLWDGEKTDLKKIINSKFSKEFLEKNQKDQMDALDGILDKRQGYLPAGKQYTLNEIDTFIELITWQQLLFQRHSWFLERANMKPAIKAEKFPSIQIFCSLVFYKFYMDNKRKAKLSDIPDLFIASSYPYIDEVITEKNQVEMVRQIQKRHNLCNQLTLYTINDFRNS